MLANYISSHSFIVIGLWGVVNNAGITGPMGLAEWIPRDDYTTTININLLGVIEVTRQFLPLVRMEKGRVVNISSVMGRIAAAYAPYVVTKYGVEGFTDCLRYVRLQKSVIIVLLYVELILKCT
jgi:NAD(P)-dependent dehydrogenase (short-subunit alcohol dehydrogenase family)